MQAAGNHVDYDQYESENKASRRKGSLSQRAPDLDEISKISSTSTGSRD
jgi:hypothetical protein